MSTYELVLYGPTLTQNMLMKNTQYTQENANLCVPRISQPCTLFRRQFRVLFLWLKTQQLHNFGSSDFSSAESDLEATHDHAKATDSPLDIEAHKEQLFETSLQVSHLHFPVSLNLFLFESLTSCEEIDGLLLFDDLCFTMTNLKRSKNSPTISKFGIIGFSVCKQNTFLTMNMQYKGRQYSPEDKISILNSVHIFLVLKQL